MAKEKQTFLKGALILIIANAVVKVIGAIFKIPLTYFLNEEGMGIFNTAYNLYAALFVIATAGLPVAVSKMVSESVTRNNHVEAKRVFSVAQLLLAIIGLVGSLILFFFAELFAESISAPNAVLAIKAIAPALFFVAIMSAYRGYFQGHQDMMPTALSEVMEALGKFVIGLGLAIFFAKNFDNIEMAAMGSVLGVTAGTILGFGAIWLIYVFGKSNRKTVKPVEIQTRHTSSKRKILRVLLFLAIPITIGASVSTLTNLLDMVMVRSQLVGLGFDTLKNIVDTIGIKGIERGNSVNDYIANMANAIYGSYSGYAVPLFNMPPTIVTAISMSIVPAIAAAFEKKNVLHARRTAESALRITILFATPCAFGLSFLASPILYSVYMNSASSQMLAILGYAVIFVSVVSVTTAMLQATGHIMIPVRNMIIGGIIKVVINYYLVGNPDININGAPIGTNVCYLVIAVLNIISVIRVMGIRFAIGDFIVKPVLSSVVMAGIAQFLYMYLQSTGALPGGFGIRVSTFAAIGAGGICYALMMFIIGGIKRDDVVMLPKGQKIAESLSKLHLIK